VKSVGNRGEGATKLLEKSLRLGARTALTSLHSENGVVLARKGVGREQVESFPENGNVFLVAVSVS
jgi:hypothetical protein